MKAKNINRKLFLNKKTIADLNGGQMEHLKAGKDKDQCNETDAESNCLTITCTYPSVCSQGDNCC